MAVDASSSWEAQLLLDVLETYDGTAGPSFGGAVKERSTVVVECYRMS